MLDSRPRGRGFEPHRRHCVVSLSKTHLSLLCTSSTHEDPSPHNWKNVDCYAKNQGKQTHCPEITCMSFSGICFSGINVFFIYFGNTNVPSECQIRYDRMSGLIWAQTMRGSRIFVRGGGGSRSVWQKRSDNGFFSPHFILQKSNGQFHRKLPFFKVPEMVNFTENYLFSKFQKGSIFQGGGPTFSRGRPIAHSL